MPVSEQREPCFPSVKIGLCEQLPDDRLLVYRRACGLHNCGRVGILGYQELQCACNRCDQATYYVWVPSQRILAGEEIASKATSGDPVRALWWSSKSISHQDVWTSSGPSDSLLVAAWQGRTLTNGGQMYFVRAGWARALQGPTKQRLFPVPAC